MAFDKIKEAQPKVVKLLENSIKMNRLSHAYLFEGEAGTKKFETAIYFAQLLLCKNEEKPCGICSNCKRIKNMIHPNVYIVEPDNNIIRKKQIVELQNEFAKTSVEPGKKIYIIKNIDQINVQAANSLLKFLEEPHPNIHAILTSSNIQKILPTIISRSQVVQFSSVSNEIIEIELLEMGYPELSAKIVSRLTNSANEAVEIASSDFFLDLVEKVKDINNILATKEEPLVIYFNENSSIIFQDKEIIKLFLQILITYQKDLIYHKIENYSKIVFKEELNTINDITKTKTKNRLIDELEDMLNLTSRLNSYINERLALDNLLLRLERR
jgi:DNA polymerase-3 subunit delta'